MNEELFFKAKNESDEWVRYEILDTFFSEETQRMYMFYTDYTCDENGKTKVYAAIRDTEEGRIRPRPIQTKAEWELIEQYLKSVTCGD